MALAPHMRQSLAYLQASTLELGQLLRKESEQNPLLEVLPPASVSSLDAARSAWDRESRADGGARTDGSPQPSGEPRESYVEAPEAFGDFSATCGESRESRGESGESSGEPAETSSEDGRAPPDHDFSVLSKLDDPDYLYSAGGNNEYDSDAEERRRFFLDSIPAGESLQQHLATQLEGCALSGRDRALAEEIVGSIDERGYLRTPLADIAQARLASIDDASRMLRLVQSFDPAGVAARDLRECLLLQLRADPPRRPGAATALRLLSSESAFSLVAAARRSERIAEKLGVPPAEAERAIEVLAELDPRPGLKFESSPPEYVGVDVVVRKADGRWTAYLDESGVPRVSLSPEWIRRRAELRGRAASALADSEKAARAEEKRWLDEKYRAAELVVQGLAQRQTTLLAVAQTVVDAQTGFFERGKAALRPLTMAEIAEKTGYGESTISRTVAGKWLRSPQGVSRLRDFFTNAVKTSDGGAAASGETLRENIRRLVAAEDPARPLSDQALSEALGKLGLSVARRTVAKYRDALRIPAAADRRRSI